MTFLNKYKTVLKNGGAVNLKTDNDGFYQYTLEKVNELNLDILEKTDNVYLDFPNDEVLSIKTHYERIYLNKGKNINYLKFKFQ